MSVTKTRIDYWRSRWSYVEGVCWRELEREELEEGWHRSVMCGKVARFLVSFPGRNHASIFRCKEHKEELINDKAVFTRL